MDDKTNDLNSLQEQLNQKEVEKNKLRDELVSKLKLSIESKEGELKELKKTLADYERSALNKRVTSNSKPLHEVLETVMAENSDALSAKELGSLVKKAGYETNSNKFTGMVLHCLNAHPNKFKRVSQESKRPLKFTLVKNS